MFKVFKRDSSRVIKDLLRLRKRNAVFLEICFGFLIVPFKTHANSICIYAYIGKMTLLCYVVFLHWTVTCR